MSTHTDGPDPRLAGVRLIALDVDGVLTDGSISYDAYGRPGQLQTFNVKDGAAFGWLRDAGVQVAWITGRGCPATRTRARELGVEELHVKVRDKAAALADVQQRLGISPEETAAMGDDLADLGLAEGSGFFAAPADACHEVRERADLITHAAGGRGAVRELAEAVLRARGAWDAVVRRYAR